METTNSSQVTFAKFGKGIVAGIITAILTAVIMILMAKYHATPFPKAVSLAFAEILLHRQLPMFIGIVFHLCYVIGWCTLYVWLMPNRYMKLWPIAIFTFFLWLIASFIFLPLIGWGIAASGLAGGKGVIATIIPHLFFGFFLWISVLILFKGQRK
jgi:hypothetical protein